MSAGDIVYCDRPTRNGIKRQVCLHVARRYENGEPRDLMVSLLKYQDSIEDSLVNVFVSRDWRGNPHESGYTKLNPGNLWESETGRYGKIGEITPARLDDVKLDILQSDMAYLLKRYTHPTNDQKGSLHGLASTGGW